MKIVAKFLFLILFFLPLILKSQPNNFYLDFKNNELEIGQYIGKNFKKKKLKKYDNPTENISEIKDLLLKNGAENVLYYFHCLYGSVRIFHKNSLKQLNQNNDSTTIITIEWHAKHAKYVKNWEQSIQQGEALQPLLLELWTAPEKNNNVLCHSMGHRIFAGTVKGLQNDKIQFKTVLFAGSDLDVNAFENDLKILPKISNEIVVYVHRNDRLLKASAKRHERKRLGLNGMEADDFLNEINNLERIDVTYFGGKSGFLATNHSYFKKDARVLQDILKRANSDASKF